MKYLGKITDDKDLVTKEYVDDASEVVQTLTTGTKIGSVGGTDLYAPTGGGGGSKNIWYATCPTAASTTAKVVTTDTGDFTLTTGNMLRVIFTYANSVAAPTLTVDSKTATSVRVATGSSSAAQYQWQAGEAVDFVYNGTYFIMVSRSIATTTYYGPTKLSSSTSSTSTSLAATPSAVKSAYDLANGKQDPLSTETISISASNFSVTTGSISSVSMMRFGNVVQLVMTVTKSSTTSAGNDMFVGTLNLTNYRPKMTTECGSYSGTIALVGRIETNGKINVNVTGAQLAANRSPILSFTYLI